MLLQRYETMAVCLEIVCVKQEIQVHTRKDYEEENK